MKKRLISLLALGVLCAMPFSAFAGDEDLVKVLLEKGVLTQGDVAKINGQGASQNGVSLLQVLQEKGVLTAAEVEKVATENIVATSPVEKAQAPSALQGLSVSMLGYLDYSAGEKAGAGDRSSSYNSFGLNRGYLTVKKTITPWLSARITTDIHRDTTESASTNGDYTLRLKYLYGEFKPNDLGPFTQMKMEAGQGHTPWLDFEEHINPYRVQGTMAIERAGIFNSSDLGVSLRGNIGGKLADAKAKTGNHHYDGLYGSWHVGLYNGGGYHADEVNADKAIEGRLSIRPAPAVVPGLQLTYLGVYGDGNKDEATLDNPDYVVNMGMLSLENPAYIVTAQYFQTTGNAGGSMTAGLNKESLDTEGYSFFGRVRLPFITNNLALFGRYDHFDQDADNIIADNTAYDMYVGGLSYDVAKGNQLILTYESTDFEANASQKHKVPVVGNNLGDEQKVQVAYQLAF
jgi:hypothetical protein